MTWGSHCAQCGKTDCEWVRGPVCEGSLRSGPKPKMGILARIRKLFSKGGFRG